MDRTEVLIAALRAAAQAILAYDPATVETTVKSSAGDLVTAADLASEKAIIDTIKTAFPDDVVISEETTSGHDMLTPERLQELTGWVVDPIDGTNNFKRGMGYSGISVGYIELGVPTLGGILDPYRNKLYLAQVGKGATCDGKSVHVSTKADFDAGTRVATSNSYEGGTQQNIDRYAKLRHVWVDVLGSAVLVYADIASGRLDLYHHNGLKSWDNAAGFLLAQEAGAKIVGLQGQPISWLSTEVVVGNPILVDKFIALTNS